MSSYDFGVRWHLRYVFALLSVCLSLLKVELGPRQPRLLELLFQVFKLFAASLFVLGSALIMAMFAMLEDIVVKSEFVNEVPTASLVDLDYLVFKRYHDQGTALESEHQEVVYQISHCWNLSFALVPTLSS